MLKATFFLIVDAYKLSQMQLINACLLKIFMNIFVLQFSQSNPFMILGQFQISLESIAPKVIHLLIVLQLKEIILNNIIKTQVKYWRLLEKDHKMDIGLPFALIMSTCGEIYTATTIKYQCIQIIQSIIH